MLKKQVWMADDDEFDHIAKISQRVLRLNDQYENHPYAKEFTKECNVMFVYGTYVLEGEAEAKFSLDDIWNLFQKDDLPNTASNFCRQMINCMKVWNYLQKTSDLPLNTEIINKDQKSRWRMKKTFWWNIKSYLYSQVITFLHQLIILKDTWKMQFFGFMRLKKMIQLWPLQICLETLFHPFEDGNGRLCRLILAHILIKMKCCLFPVILNSFHRRGRRHYIRVVKMFDRKPSMLYTMIVKSLIHC